MRFMLLNFRIYVEEGLLFQNISKSKNLPMLTLITYF